MNGRIVITTGYNGWGNRKSGCEAYGPGGRWAGPIELPNRANENVVYGDLLGDHLDELGCHEGSPFIVIAATSRFDAEWLDGLRERLARFIAAEEHTELWADEIRVDRAVATADAPQSTSGSAPVRSGPVNAHTEEGL